TLTKAGSQTIVATDTVTAAITGTLALNVRGTAASLDVVVPATAKAGTAFSVAVTAKNSDGTTATGYNGTVHFTSSDTSTGVVLPADTMPSTGQATLAATLIKSGAQTITGRDTVTATITGTLSVTVRAANATKLVLSSSATPTAGATFSFSVTAQDQFGNTDTGYAGTVHFATSDPPAGGVLPADS